MSKQTRAVLIVNDAKDKREALSTVLQSQGYDTTSVASAKKALEKAASQFFDLILLYTNLPNNEGVQLLSDFKRVAPETISTMVTDSPLFKNTGTTPNRSANLYLTKPNVPDNFLEAIRSKQKGSREKGRNRKVKTLEWIQQCSRNTQLANIRAFSQKTADRFASFGLTVTQAKVYISLVALGTASASEIAALSKTRREEVYRTLPELQKRGLVIRRFGIPGKFVAMKPAVALEILSKLQLYHLKKKMCILKQEKDALISQLGRIMLPTDEEEPSTELLFQRDCVLTKLVDMTKRAESQLVAALPSARLSQMLLQHAIKSEMKGQFKINMQIVIEKCDAVELAQLLKANVCRSERLELRQAEKLPFNLLIIDGKEAIFREPYQESENTSVFWTNCRTYVTILKMAFENLWQQSQQLDNKVTVESDLNTLSETSVHSS